MIWVYLLLNHLLNQLEGSQWKLHKQLFVSFHTLVEVCWETCAGSLSVRSLAKGFCCCTRRCESKVCWGESSLASLITNCLTNSPNSWLMNELCAWVISQIHTYLEGGRVQGWVSVCWQGAGDFQIFKFQTFQFSNFHFSFSKFHISTSQVLQISAI